MEIDALRMPGLPGDVGLLPCPGRPRHGWRGIVGRRRSALTEDLEAIRAWGGTALISLVEHPELVALGIPDLGQAVTEAGLAWYPMPIPDFCPPGPVFERCWRAHRTELYARLRNAERIAIHCLAGLGRTGTVMARMLVESGMEPEDAVRAVRAARPGAIQSEEQLDYVLDQLWTDLNPR